MEKGLTAITTILPTQNFIFYSTTKSGNNHPRLYLAIAGLMGGSLWPAATYNQECNGLPNDASIH